MILGGELFAKLSWPVYGWIDLPAELRFTIAEGGYHIRETYLADHHQIHVARCVLVPTCNRAVNKSKSNALDDGSEPFIQNVSYSGRFRKNALQLCEDRVLTIRLVVDLMATANSLNEPYAS